MWACLFAGDPSRNCGVFFWFRSKTLKPKKTNKQTLRTGPAQKEIALNMMFVGLAVRTVRMVSGSGWSGCPRLQERDSSSGLSSWWIVCFVLFCFVCLFACLPACPFIRPSICLSVCLSFCLSVYLSVCQQFLSLLA